MCGFGLTIILFFEKVLNFKIMIGWFTLITVRVYLTLVHQTDPVFCKCSG